jgi:MFS family permease
MSSESVVREPVAPVVARWLLTTIAVIGAATIFGLTYSLTAPLIAFDLERQGQTEFVIGLNAAMHAVGVLLIAPFLPRLSLRFGPRLLIVVALVASAGLLLLFPVFPQLPVWFALRVGLGMAAETLFVLTETWTNDLSDDRIRGRMMATYTAALSLGMVGGPAILSVLGPERQVFRIGAAIAAAAIICVAWPGVTAPPRGDAEVANPWQYLRLAPIAIATTILNASIETAGLSFIAIYATGRGWTEARAMQLVSTLLLGAIILQLPIGWLADKMPGRRLALLLAVLSAGSALAWPFMLDHQALAFAVVFVWGGLFVGIYTVMLTMVGSRFRGTDLVGIYAVMGLAWGIGALVGPSLAGAAMHQSPAYGLPVFVACACAAFALFMAASRSET